jgi:hypothetical protein
MRLFHFSEDAEIISFKPRVIAVSTQRRNGEDWLNDPLVWAIDERHQFLYLFPVTAHEFSFGHFRIRRISTNRIGCGTPRRKLWFLLKHHGLSA